MAQTWKGTATSGSWNTAANWSSGTVPNSIGANVTLGTVISHATTIGLNGNTETVGTLTINNTAGSYTVGSSANDGALNFQVSSGTASLVSTASSATINSTFKISSNTVINNTGTLRINGQVNTGTNSYTKTGAGTLVIGGNLSNNTGGGTGAKVTVNQGTLELAVNGGQGVANGTAVSVNSGGTLLMGGNAELYGNDVTLNGGTFAANGTTQGNLGTLTLSANSTISLGAAGASLQFDDSGAGTGVVWASGATLTILGWVSSDTVAVGHGGSGSLALTAAQVAQIDFNINGTLYTAQFNNSVLTPGSVIPTPESPVIFCAILLIGLIAAVEIHSRIKRAKPAADSITEPLHLV